MGPVLRVSTLRNQLVCPIVDVYRAFNDEVLRLQKYGYGVDLVALGNAEAAPSTYLTPNKSCLLHMSKNKMDPDHLLVT